jgi:hypothetical protein
MASSRSAAARIPSGVLGDAALLKRFAAAFGLTPEPAGREALSALSRSLPCRFPPLFEQLVTSYRWGRTDLGPLTLLANPPGPDLSGLMDGIFRDAALAERLLAAGHLPFAAAPGGAGPVCFDTARRRPDRDAPVVLVDAEGRLLTEIAGSFRQLVSGLSESGS